MKTGNSPQPPRCSLAGIQPDNFTDEDLARLLWQKYGKPFFHDLDFSKLTWMESQVINKAAEKLYGRRG